MQVRWRSTTAPTGQAKCWQAVALWQTLDCSTQTCTATWLVRQAALGHCRKAADILCSAFSSGRAVGGSSLNHIYQRQQTLRSWLTSAICLKVLAPSAVQHVKHAFWAPGKLRQAVVNLCVGGYQQHLHPVATYLHL